MNNFKAKKEDENKKEQTSKKKKKSMQPQKMFLLLMAVPTFTVRWKSRTVSLIEIAIHSSEYIIKQLHSLSAR